MKKRRRNETFSDRFWLDKDGNLTIIQKPNRYLTVWIVSVLLQIILGAGNAISGIARIVGAISLVIWAVVEAWKGDSYFRKIIGYCVLVLMAFIYII